MFSWLGARLERHIDLLVDKLGYGPLALRRKFDSQMEGFYWRTVLDEESAKNQRRRIMKLVKYIRYAQFLLQYYMAPLADFNLYGDKYWYILHTTPGYRPPLRLDFL